MTGSGFVQSQVEAEALQFLSPIFPQPSLTSTSSSLDHPGNWKQSVLSLHTDTTSMHSNTLIISISNLNVTLTPHLSLKCHRLCHKPGTNKLFTYPVFARCLFSHPVVPLVVSQERKLIPSLSGNINSVPTNVQIMGAISQIAMANWWA